MKKDDREDELWNLIRFTKDATSEQKAIWCRELHKLLLEKDKQTIKDKEVMMTKQEEIREEMAECFYYFSGWDGETKWEDVSEENREDCYDFADASMRKLHSQGVVIEVDRELPYTYRQQFVDYPTGDDGELDMAHPKFEVSVMTIPEGIRRSIKDAGYVAVAPLIKASE